MECHVNVQPFFFLLTNDGKKCKGKTKAHNPFLGRWCDRDRDGEEKTFIIKNSLPVLKGKPVPYY